MENVNSVGEKIWVMMTTYGVRVLGVLVALFVAWIVAGIVQRWILKGLNRAKFDATLSRFFGNMARYAIILFALVGCLGVFGIQTASFAAVIAAAGLAIGLAFQGSLGNLASGVMLLIFRPFKVGNFVSVAGVMGTVEEIELFTTTLNTLDNRRIIIPNGNIFGSVIENVTHHPTRRVDVPVGVDYSADIEKTRKVLEEAITSIPDVLGDPAPQVFLAGLGASSVDWQVRIWCKTEDYWTVFQNGIQAVKNHLDKANIGIPFPQMDVHFDAPVVENLRSDRVKNAHA